MSIDEYDFLIEMVLGLNKKGKDHPFGGL